MVAATITSAKSCDDELADGHANGTCILVSLRGDEYLKMDLPNNSKGLLPHVSTKYRPGNVDATFTELVIYRAVSRKHQYREYDIPFAS